MRKLYSDWDKEHPKVCTREKGNIPGCISAGGLHPKDQPGYSTDSIANQYCKAIEDLVAGRISERVCFSILSERRVLTRS
jgi:hypothetical protein